MFFLLLIGSWSATTSSSRVENRNIRAKYGLEFCNSWRCNKSLVWRVHCKLLSYYEQILRIFMYVIRSIEYVFYCISYLKIWFKLEAICRERHFTTYLPGCEWPRAYLSWAGWTWYSNQSFYGNGTCRHRYGKLCLK